MLALLQRARRASVSVDDIVIGEIGPGLMVLVGVERADTEAQAERMAERLLGYRVFEDAAGKMNLSLVDVGGGLLLVPQFTLPADTSKGTRPSFTPAAPPALGQTRFEQLVGFAEDRHRPVETGAFGAHMMVSLVNDGPVTLMLKT